MDNFAFIFGQFSDHPVEEEGDFIEEAFLGSDILEDDGVGMVAEAHFLFAGEVTGGVDDDGGRFFNFLLESFEELAAVHIGEAEVEDDEIELGGLEVFEGFLAGGD
jgi:hypothetical protein